MRTIYRDILIGCLIIAVVIFTSILLPCVGVLTIADYGSYTSGVGNILLSVIAFFSFCVAYKSYAKEVKTDSRYRSEKLYNRYNDFITKILENYNNHKSHLNYLRPYYDEYGRLGNEAVSDEECLHVLTDEFDMVLSAISSEDYEELTEKHAEELSEEMMSFYENMVDCNRQNEQQGTLNRMVEEARRRLICRNYNLTHATWQSCRNITDDERFDMVAELFVKKNHQILYPMTNSLEAVGRHLSSAEWHEKTIGMKRNPLYSYAKSFFTADDIKLIEILARNNNEIKKLIQ